MLPFQKIKKMEAIAEERKIRAEQRKEAMEAMRKEQMDEEERLG
jgi:hypothetical protein